MGFRVYLRIIVMYNVLIRTFIVSRRRGVLNRFGHAYEYRWKTNPSAAGSALSAYNPQDASARGYKSATNFFPQKRARVHVIFPISSRIPFGFPTPLNI